MKVTANTITDEQIRELARLLKAELEFVSDSDGARITEIHDQRDLCLAALNRYGYRRDPFDVRGPEFDTVRSARAHCADIINARSKP